MIINLKLAGVG